MNSIDSGSTTLELVWENMCRAHRKVRTRKDLLGIELEPSHWLIKCVTDWFMPQSGEISDNKLKWSWILYLANCKVPATKTWQDRLRWNLRLKLIQWGII